MKAILFFISLSFMFTSSAWGSNDNDPYVYTTKHQGYTCERWGKQGYKKSVFEKEWGYKFKSLEISKTTRKARIKITSQIANENKCLYTANFTRQKGNTYVDFESSSVNDPNRCHDMKAELDTFMAPGWNYKIKFNKYLSVYFASEIESKCSETTGESYARFYYDILSS